ncbi:MAG: hypothetical protein AAF242_12160, partial [Bacteroidota bacterium]
IKIKTKDQVTSIFLNDELIDQVEYQEPLGTLTCIRFKFDDNGVVDYVNLTDSEGNIKYTNNFSNELTSFR